MSVNSKGVFLHPGGRNGVSTPWYNEGIWNNGVPELNLSVWEIQCIGIVEI